MADTASDYVSAVNGVIAVCKDAQEGFRGAADAVKDSSLKSVFEEYSAQRGRFAEQLRSVVKHTGNEPADPAGVAGTLHRGWIVLKGVLTGHSEHQILEETERGEDLSVSRYKEALAKELPAQVRSVLQEQYNQVQQAHDRIRTLRDSTGRATS
jgi:uncharacterized protein (TIGR02284 family)